MSDLSRMKSPNQLAQARAAYARARLALDQTRDRLKHTKGQVAARRALLDEAKCWGRIGETAERVREALEATIPERRGPRTTRSSASKAKRSASAKRYWDTAAPERRAAHVRSIFEGRRRAAEKRKRRAE